MSGNDVDARARIFSAILNCLAEDARAILIDSGGRVTLPNEHSLRLSSSHAGDDVILQALRMRPDYLVVADAAGYATLDALFSMGANVNGGMIGVDADTPENALDRICRHASTDSRTTADRIQSLVRDRIDILVQVLSYADGTERITQITDVDGELQDTFTGFDEFSASGQSPQWYEDAIRLGHPLEDHLFN